jgi:hypothetical protein
MAQQTTAADDASSEEPKPTYEALKSLPLAAATNVEYDLALTPEQKETLMLALSKLADTERTGLEYLDWPNGQFETIEETVTEELALAAGVPTLSGYVLKLVDLGLVWLDCQAEDDAYDELAEALRNRIDEQGDENHTPPISSSPLHGEALRKVLGK